MQEKRNRVLLALDISPRSQAALGMAATLAAELDAELAGLFVEDVDLLRLSGLPFTREIGFFSPVSRPVESQSMEQALRREAEAVRRMLGEVAGRQQLRWSFQVVRGRVSAELFSLAGEFDLVVLGKRPRLGLRPLGDALAGPAARSHLPKPVLVVLDGFPAAQRALELGLQQSRSNGAELRLLIAAATDEEFLRQSEQAEAWLAERGVAAPVPQHLVAGDIAALAAAARTADAAVLVIGDGCPRGCEGFAALINEINCPVILIA